MIRSRFGNCVVLSINYGSTGFNTQKECTLYELLCMLHRHYRATTACNLYSLSPTLEDFCMCGNSKEVEITGNVSDWVTCNVLCQLCGEPKIGTKES